MDAARTNHIIRFGPLTFRPVKGKLKKKQQMNSNYRCNGIFVSQQMEAGHVATHMIFHAITADQKCSYQNTSPRGPPRVSGKIWPFCAKRYDRQNEARGSPHWILVLNPGFLTVRQLFILSASTPFCCLQSS